jgi:hypothetical protein
MDPYTATRYAQRILLFDLEMMKMHGAIFFGF